MTDLCTPNHHTTMPSIEHRCRTNDNHMLVRRRRSSLGRIVSASARRVVRVGLRGRARQRAAQVVHAGEHLRDDAALHLALHAVALGRDGVDLVCGTALVSRSAAGEMQCARIYKQSLWL